ncbi:hypothetical protein [Brucella intermedia]|uniref:hypothetical protein n=1 Tax=Brucella intermedia TaxID=94625 RepID=UPI00124F18DC|nr:hypothetical protein [Brucella intermedia]KAB2723297.1 low affinity iron permease family protein [Brucella intermedia]
MENICARFSEKAASAAGNQYTLVNAILFIAAWASSGPFWLLRVLHELLMPEPIHILPTIAGRGMCVAGSFQS